MLSITIDNRMDDQTQALLLRIQLLFLLILFLIFLLSSLFLFSILQLSTSDNSILPQIPLLRHILLFPPSPVPLFLFVPLLPLLLLYMHPPHLSLPQLSSSTFLHYVFIMLFLSLTSYSSFHSFSYHASSSLLHFHVFLHPIFLPTMPASLSLHPLLLFICLLRLSHFLSLLLLPCLHLVRLYLILPVFLFFCVPSSLFLLPLLLPFLYLSSLFLVLDDGQTVGRTVGT